MRTIGQIERLSAVEARVELRFRFRLRASFQGTGQRQFDAGAAGFDDAAGADAVLLFELSDAAAPAVDESDFEDSLPELPEFPESDAPSLFVAALAPSSFLAAAPLLPPRKSVTYQPEPFN
ncbi:hypothetical protein [Caballeronia mineralivorans]|uniref:hypothetical protein n=1 Tax=Caballeronia mineralivorans TaxID=2010198 RepID=UPI00069E3FB0|nr:hypothetical protein [Caballeronia mineralivorans]